MHGGAPAAWHERPIDEARRVHDHYVRTVPDRVARFEDLMGEAGFPLEHLDWSNLDALDGLRGLAALVVWRQSQVRAPESLQGWTEVVSVLAPPRVSTAAPAAPAALSSPHASPPPSSPS